MHNKEGRSHAIAYPIVGTPAHTQAQATYKTLGHLRLASVIQIDTVKTQTTTQLACRIGIRLLQTLYA